MKFRTTKNSHKLFDAHPCVTPRTNGGGEGAHVGGHPSAFGKIQQRYATIALTAAVILGAVFMILGYPGLGKGLILGALFSVVNFLLMAMALPYRLGKSRAQTLLVSLSSIYIRYAILAVPLVWALKNEAIALLTVVAGLFMVQGAIVGDHLVARVRYSMERG